MKFSDLFLPRIARSNPEVRISAVQDETNLELLQKVLEKDEDENVREAVRVRIKKLKASKAE